MKLLEVVWNFPNNVMKPFNMYYFYWPLKEAIRRGWEAEVLTFKVGVHQPEQEIIDGICVRRCPASGPKGRIWSPTFIHALLTTDADIVHFHGYGDGRRELAIPIIHLRKRHVQVVFTPHFHQAYPYGRLRRVLYDKLVGRRIFNMSDRVIVFTDYTYQKLKALGINPALLRIVPHVARPDVFSILPDEPPAGTLLREAGVIGSPLILGVGQMIERKGWEYTLRCMPAIVARYPQAKLLIIGASQNTLPEYRQRFFQLANDLGVIENIQLMQDNSPEFIRDAFRAATLLTHPSFIESFGIVLIEAMAAGLPIVAHNGTGIPCVVDDGKCGYVVDVRDIDMYTKRLLAILDDAELRQRMGQEGIRQAQDRFSEAKIADQLFAVYSELPGQAETPISSDSVAVL